MKKTGRILLILLVIVVSTLLLYPTIKWYMFVPESTKRAAAGSNEDIREYAMGEYAMGQAVNGVKELKSLLAENRNSAVPDKFGYLIDFAEKELKEGGKQKPSEWTVYSLLSAFPTESALFDSIESYYRDDLLEAKRLSGNVLQLGLECLKPIPRHIVNPMTVMYHPALSLPHF